MLPVKTPSLKSPLVFVLIMFLFLAAACEIRFGSPGGSLDSVRAYLKYDVRLGLILTWQFTETIPWISRAVFSFDPADLNFNEFWRDPYFDYFSIPQARSINSRGQHITSLKHYFDFNDSGSFEAETDATVEWKSSDHAIEFLYPAPAGDSILLRPGTYTYRFPASSLVQLLKPYFEYTIDLETVAGPPRRFYKLMLPQGAILPQIATGREANLEIESRIDIVNPNLRETSVTVRFLTSQGTPWPVLIGSELASEHQLSIAAESSLSVVVRSQDAPSAGWALASQVLPVEDWLENSAAVDFNVTFTTSIDGEPVAEAGLAGADPSNHQLFGPFKDSETGLDSGFALANPFDEEVTVVVSYSPGTDAKPLVTELTLSALGQQAVFFSQLFPDLPGPQNEGTVRFFSDHDFGAVQLRTKDGKQFSSLQGSVWR